MYNISEQVSPYRQACNATVRTFQATEVLAEGIYRVLHCANEEIISKQVEQGIEGENREALMIAASSDPARAAAIRDRIRAM